MRALLIKSVGRAAPHVVGDIGEVMERMGHEVGYVDAIDISKEDPEELEEKRNLWCMELTTEAMDYDVVIGYGLNNFQIYQEGDIIKDAVIDAGCKSVSILYDSPLTPGMYTMMQNFSHRDTHGYFVWDRHWAKRMEVCMIPNVYWMPIGVNTERFKKVELTDEQEKKYGCDMSFVGSWSEEREAFLSAVAQNFKGKFRIYGT
jgi:hypothetical protein